MSLNNMDFSKNSNLSLQLKDHLQKGKIYDHLMGSYHSNTFHFNNVYGFPRTDMDLKIIPDLYSATIIIWKKKSYLNIGFRTPYLTQKFEKHEQISFSNSF